MDRPPQIVLQRKSRTELERLLADGNTAQKIAKREDCAHERRWSWRHGDHAGDVPIIVEIEEAALLASSL